MRSHKHGYLIYPTNMAIWFIPQTCDPTKMAIWFVPQTWLFDLSHKHAIPQTWLFDLSHKHGYLICPTNRAIWFIPQRWLFDLSHKHDMHPSNMRVMHLAHSIWSAIFESSFQSLKIKLVCRSLWPCFSDKRLRAFSCELCKELSNMSLQCDRR